MLVLSRQVNETIRIGDNICIKVLSSRDNQVRLGISAPEHIPVHREEIYQQLQAKKRKG
ncbi:MAG: carbon storage regulator CsrA [Gammaproteobacteria bacterium]|jgi:carbon storage regulator CsrA|nr:carbon storage regulator CsrA [Gammaproteobacteria bacterium]